MSPPPIVDGFIEMIEAPGHGLTLNEHVARKHLKKARRSSANSPTNADDE